MPRASLLGPRRWGLLRGIGRNGRGYEEEVCPALSMGGGVTSDTRPCVVQPVAHTLRGAGFGASEDGTGRGTPIIAQPFGVRRLTPRECERLQGFPDDHTLITYRGKPAANSPRYKALGNSMAVNVMSWIGQRIDQEVKP